MEEKEQKAKSLISAVFAGAAGGILMAAVLLFLISTSGFVLHMPTVILIAIAASFLPACMDFLRKRGIPYGISEVLMIAVSAFICILYASAVSVDQSTRTLMLRPVVVIHIISLVFNVARILYMERRKEEKQ